MNWTPHPILEPPCSAVLGRLDPDSDEDRAWLTGVHWQYHELIRLSREDPYRHGFVLPHWKEALDEMHGVDEEWIFGGNRSSKSAFSAWLVVQSLMKNAGSRILCWSQNDEVSKTLQQPYLWEALPIEMRRKQRDSVAKVVYSKANGFTDKNFILPNGSQCIFKTYTQFANDNTCVEGIELGWKSLDGEEPEFLNCGNWFDEYLGDTTLLDTIRYRLSTRNAKNLVTFTPIDGYTETVRTVLEGAETLQSVPAELLDGELVPVVQRPATGSRLIRYFHTADNPFNDYARFSRDIEGKAKEVIKVRAYGLPVKAATTRFPKFQRSVNVRPHEEVMEAASRGTKYCMIDPAGAKNWFICWVSVTVCDTWYVYREWPDADTYGPWAEFGKASNGRHGSTKWRPGSAQKGLGYGIRDYTELILAEEDGEEIMERIIDPRMGSARYADAVGQSSIIQDLEDNDMVCRPAPGVEIDDGLALLMGKMAYDDRREIDAMNRPHFIVSEKCGNIISALGEYTGEDGLKEAWKDPIDVLRYAAVSEIDHVTAKSTATACRGSGGY